MKTDTLFRKTTSDFADLIRMNDRNRIPGRKLWSLIFIQAKYGFSVPIVRLDASMCGFFLLHTKSLRLYRTHYTIRALEWNEHILSPSGFLYENKQTTNTRKKRHHYYSRCLFVKYRPVYRHSFHSHTYLQTLTHSRPAHKLFFTLIIWVCILSGP